MITTKAEVHAVPEPGLGNTSYVIDAGDGTALFVDPPRDIGRHLELARSLKLRPATVLETHLHADFVSGAREFAAAAGTQVIAAADAAVAFPHRGVRGGETIRFGAAELSVLETPGHTPEHVAYLLSLDGRPHSVFSGGSLIAGGAARTDLVDPALTEALARSQFRSLRRLADLPDETILYPTHGAGSFCSAGPATEGMLSIGDQRRTNPLLRTDDEDEFVRMLLDSYTSFPPYFLKLRPVNRVGPVLAHELPRPRAMSPSEAASEHERGAVIIDVRPAADWAAKHVAGSVANALRPVFASWLGWIVPFGTPIVLVAHEGQVAEAVTQARRIGYDAVLGWIDGGVEAWEAEGRPVTSVPVIDAREAQDAVSDGATLLDVRQKSEAAISRVPGSVHIELGDIIAGRRPDARSVVVYCGHGERSATAASLLESDGVRVANLAGGIEAWAAAGLPLQT